MYLLRAKRFTFIQIGKTKVKLISAAGMLAALVVATIAGLSVFHAYAAVQPVTANSRFVWRLQGAPSASHFGSETGPKVYDFDPDNTDTATIANLKSAGITTICYFSAGSAEDWRGDYGSFLSADKLGALPGWAGEYVLDINSANVRSIMSARLQHMSDIGCDGVEPDNVDAYADFQGFSSPNEANTLGYLQFLATEAHSRNLSIALKNAVDVVGANLPNGNSVVSTFDFAVVEECYAYNECAGYQSFADADKAVFIVEYGNSPNCTDANSRDFDAYKMSIALDGSLREPCRTSGGATQPPADTTNPTVSLTAPANGATVSGTSVSLTATASDNVGVTKVEFYRGTTLLSTDTTSPYSYTWDSTSVTNGSYSLTAKAYDAADNVATSTAVSVTVDNQADTGGTAGQFTVPSADGSATGAQITVKLSGPCQTNLDGASSPAPTGLQSVVAGFGFTVDCQVDGDSLAVVVDLGVRYDNTKLKVYKKTASGEPLDITSQVTLGYASTSPTSYSTVSYTVTDGSQFDEDGLANGTIVDPIYVALASAAPSGGQPSTNSAPSPSNGVTNNANSTLQKTGVTLIAASVMAIVLLAAAVRLITLKRRRVYNL